MASLLSWLGKGANTVYHGVSPFDNGQGWTTKPPRRRPTPAPQMSNYRTPVNIGNLRVRNPGPLPRGNAPDPVAEAAKSLVLQPVRNIQDLIKSPVNYLNELDKSFAPKYKVKEDGHINVASIKPDPKLVAAVALSRGGRIKPVNKIPKITNTKLAIKPTSGSFYEGGVLKDIDPRLASRVYQRREMAEIGAAAAKAKLKITETLKPKEQTNLARVLKGTEKPINPKVKAAAEETRKVLTSTYFRAKKTGVPVKPFRKNYFPQIYPRDMFKVGTKQSDRAIKDLIRTGKAKNEEEAIRVLRSYRQARALTPYANLSKTRSLDIPGYAENNAALHQYLDRANASIAHVKAFGPEEKVLNKILNDVRKKYGDEVYDQAVKSYRQATGLERGSERAQAVSRAATNFQGLTKLGLSTLGNVQQQVNNAIAGGVGRTGKSVVKYPFSKSDKAFVKKTGVTSEQASHEALFGEQGISGKSFRIPKTNKEVSTRNITAPGFEATEKSNRAIGAVVGRDTANTLAKKAYRGDKKAAAQLERQFNITRYKKSGLYEADKVKAAREFVHRTQFRTGPQDLPGWATSPGGRVVSQFKRYPYKQAGFIKREIIDEARKGNINPLVRWAGVGIPVGIGANAMTNKVRGYDFENKGVKKGLDIASDVTGANLIAGLAQQLYPDSHDANAYTAKVFKTLGGPTVGDAVKLGQAGFDLTKGKPTNAGRFGLQHVPVVGTPASNRVLPYSSKSKPGNTVSKPNLDPNSEQAKEDSKTQTEDFKKRMPKKGYALTKLPNGKYIYSINGQVHTASKLDTAGNAIRRDAFLKSGESYKFIPNIRGGIVLRKSPSGNVTTESKLKFDYSLNSATLTAFKNAGDYQGWINVAKEQLKNIDKQLKDPATDPLDALRLQNQAAYLLKNIDKYTAYGGFRKGSSGRGGRGGRGGGRSGKGSFKFSSYKTASKSKAPKPPTGIRVKKVTVTKPRATKKLSVPKKPKIS